MSERSRMTTGPSWGGLAFALAALAVGSQAVRADRIALRGGGEIEGIVLPEADPEDEGRVLVLTRTSSRPLEFRSEKIARVTPVDDALREYLNRRGRPRADGEAEYQLGLWCEQNGLTGPAQIHYRRAVELDKDHDEAHKKLGHVNHNGTWMTYDEQRQKQGLVKYKGRWISEQERQELEDKESFTAEQASWARRLKILRRQWLAGDDAQRQQAEEQLAAIREPAAVRPLVSAFRADPEPVRARLAGFLGAIPGRESLDALVRLALSEPSLEVRQAILEEIRARQDLETVPRFVDALRSKDPIVVGRAAWALGELGAVAAVPKLIPVLVKVERRMVMEPGAPDPGPGIAFSSIGPGPLLPPGGGGAYAVSGGASGTVGGAYVGNGSSIPVVTGPVVGPGVVAFGATSVPYGSYAGMSVGGANPNRPVMRIQTNVYQNEEVLVALRKLTGQDFGYDIPSWRRWMQAAFRPQTAPPRSVPQP